MLILYGILFIVIERVKKRSSKKPKITETSNISYVDALKIGGFQILSLVPGTSRSGSTIIGGLLSGASREVAAEFSFFLAVPTMAAASGYKLMKLVTDPAGVSLLTDHLLTLLIGNVVAFIVAIAAIKFFIDFLTKYGFKAFGYYRIIVGLVLLALMAIGVDLSII